MKEQRFEKIVKYERAGESLFLIFLFIVIGLWIGFGFAHIPDNSFKWCMQISFSIANVLFGWFILFKFRKVYWSKLK